MADDVRSDLARERQREPHRSRTVTASSWVSNDRTAAPVFILRLRRHRSFYPQIDADSNTKEDLGPRNTVSTLNVEGHAVSSPKPLGSPNPLLNRCSLGRGLARMASWFDYAQIRLVLGQGSWQKLKA